MEGFLNFAALVSFLEANKFPFKADVDRQILELPSNAAPLPGNLIVKWEKQFPFFNLIQFMVADVPAARIPDVETAIARLNCNLEVPGLGFDHSTNRIFFRMLVPVFAPAGIAPNAFNQLGQGVVKEAKGLYATMKAIVDGRSGADVLAWAGEVAAAARKAKEVPGGALS